MIDQVTSKSALLVMTKDANKKYRDLTNEEFESKDEKYREKVQEEIRQHRSACRAIMQIQKENHMYAIHIGERGGTTWEGIEEIESEQIGIAAVVRKGEISNCKGNILTNSGDSQRNERRITRNKTNKHDEWQMG